jgi:hypothetical protein
MQREAALLLVLSAATACTGLVAGPETSAVAPLTASHDSAYVRARRAVQAEGFTVDVADSLRGRLVGTRYASSNAKIGTPAACRVRLALQIEENSTGASVATTSRWIAPEPMEQQAPTACEKERADVLTRVTETIEPPAQ